MVKILASGDEVRIEVIMPHATDAKPAKARRIDFQSCRGVLGGLCVREFISGFGVRLRRAGTIPPPFATFASFV